MFFRKLISNWNEKDKSKNEQAVYLGMSILDISKTLCYMDTDSFIVHIKTEDFYKDIPSDVEKWFETSKYDKCNSVQNDK